MATPTSNPALDLDLDQPDNPNHEFAQFGAGCFWGCRACLSEIACNLLSLFWSRHDPTTLNRQGGDVGTQYRSGIYHYNDAQAELAQKSKEAKQLESKDNKVVTEILPAKRFYRAEEYHQQYLEKGGRRGVQQSAVKGCNDPIRCYG
ncbi:MITOCHONDRIAL PEPTIDE METHIONINE SULFOXIDE REDUCTASE [Salix purpurea]|uniref:peptide-methionine (S)-S-oxide reductase n=1 Tax=Salix purpurea TaxID=77065 RepID=A0A9Q0VJ67_SALPP|nr:MITOCHONDRIAL PEPTIDE METHIONINE SULFOXIDE REDUCTASE [Salix purpurea]